MNNKKNISINKLRTEIMKIGVSAVLRSVNPLTKKAINGTEYEGIDIHSECIDILKELNQYSEEIKTEIKNTENYENNLVTETKKLIKKAKP